MIAYILERVGLLAFVLMYGVVLSLELTLPRIELKFICIRLPGLGMMCQESRDKIDLGTTPAAWDILPTQAIQGKM